MTILAVSFAALGELARLGMRNASIARDKTTAELLCQSKMAEIVAGVMLPEPVQGAPFEDLGDGSTFGWLYSVDVEMTDQEGLLSVRVTVFEDLPPESRPIQFSLVRWIFDPELELAVAAMEEEQAQAESDTMSDPSTTPAPEGTTP